MAGLGPRRAAHVDRRDGRALLVGAAGAVRAAAARKPDPGLARGPGLDAARRREHGAALLAPPAAGRVVVAAARRAAPISGAAATNANSRRAASTNKWRRRRRRRAARARARAEPHGVAALGLGVRRSWWR